MKKVMFISSMGGHLTEMMQLKGIFKNYDYMIVTEKHKSTSSNKVPFQSHTIFTKQFTPHGIISLLEKNNNILY